MLGIVAILATRGQGVSAVEAYHDLQARLARYATVRLTAVPLTGDAWDHEGEYGYLRPNKGFRHEPNLGFATDGRRSGGIGLQGRTRPARKGDVARYMGLPGFETFFDPATRVAGDAPPRVVAWGGQKVVALDLILGDSAGALYLDPSTRLPVAWAVKDRNGADFVRMAYTDVRLGAAVHPDLLIPPRSG